MTSAALIPAERPEPAIKACPAPGTSFRRPPIPVASTAGQAYQATVPVGQKCTGAPTLVQGGPARCWHFGTPNSRKPSLFTTGRSARSGRAPFPATRWATPVVRGARARRSPLRKGQNLADYLRENANRAPALSHPSGASPRPDGIGFWQLSHLRGGRAKSVDVSLFARIKAAYLDYCERQVRALEHEIAVEKAMHEDDSIADLEREAARLASQIAARKQARLKRHEQQ